MSAAVPCSLLSSSVSSHLAHPPISLSPGRTGACHGLGSAPPSRENVVRHRFFDHNYRIRLPRLRSTRSRPPRPRLRRIAPPSSPEIEPSAAASSASSGRERLPPLTASPATTPPGPAGRLMSWFGAPYSDLHVPDDLELCNCSKRTDDQLHSCKKHLSMELKCLFQYIVNQLKKGLGTELVVLEELIQQIANVQYTENMTDEQDAMSGSETLRLQSSLFGSTRNYKVLNISLLTNCAILCFQKMNLNLQFLYYCSLPSTGPREQYVHSECPACTQPGSLDECVQNIAPAK